MTPDAPHAPAARPARPPRGPAVVALWATSACFLLVVWCAVVVVIAQQVRQARREQAQVALSTSKGFAEYVGLHLLVYDTALLELRDTYYDRTGALPAQAELRQALRTASSLLLQVTVADERGRVVASTWVGPLGGVSIADRPHFLELQADPGDRLVISPPVVGRLSGKMSVQLVRPRLGPDGSFRGVIVASIDVIALQEYFRGMGLDADAVVTLVGRLDGVVRARYARDGASWGQSIAASPHWATLGARQRGSYVATSVVDGVQRVYGFHAVSDQPLVVAVGDRMLPWWQVNSTPPTALALTALLSAVLLFLTACGARAYARKQRLIAELQASRAREAHASKLKSSFLATISHELRTPLNAILGFSEVIRDCSGEEETRRNAALVHAGGRHLQSLVDTLLDLAAIEAGRLQVRLEPVDLAPLLRTLADVHAAGAEAKGLRLQLVLPSDDPLCLVTDRTRLVRVLDNVLHNAVKFTDAGQVTLRPTVRGDRLELDVEDTGRGIAADRIPHLFERFTTPDTPEEGQGSGLGLAHSRELLVLLGGSISLRSQPGQGTCVRITLPRVQETQAP